MAILAAIAGLHRLAGLNALFRFDSIAFERIELLHDQKLSLLSLYSAFAPRGGGLLGRLLVWRRSVPQGRAAAHSPDNGDYVVAFSLPDTQR